MKRLFLPLFIMVLLVGCKKDAVVEEASDPVGLAATTAPAPDPIGTILPPPCPNSWEPWNNSFPGPLVQVPPHPNSECALILTTSCSAGEVDNWRFNDPNYFDQANVIMVKAKKSLTPAVFRVTITSTFDNSIRADGIVNMGTGTYTSLGGATYVNSNLCLGDGTGCTDSYDCITGAFYYSIAHGLDGVSVRITNMSSQNAFCYDVYTQYIGP